MEQLEKIAIRLEKAVDETSALAADSRIQFDTMLEMQTNERMEMQKVFAQEKKDLLDHFEQSDKRKNKIIMGLLISLVLIIGGLVGGAVYILANYDLAVVTSQNVSSDDNSTAIIYDGINLSSQQE